MTFIHEVRCIYTPQAQNPHPRPHSTTFDLRVVHWHAAGNACATLDQHRLGLLQSKFTLKGDLCAAMSEKATPRNPQPYVHDFVDHPPDPSQPICLLAGSKQRGVLIAS